MRADQAIQQVRDAVCMPARHEDGASAAETLSSLHPLACSATGYSRRRIRKAIEALRNSLQSRAQWDTAKPENQHRLLKYHRDTEGKRKALQLVRTTVEKCLEIARTQDPFASPCRIAAAKIVLAGKKAGALIHEEAASAQKGPEVSVCGSSFLVDFHLHIGQQRADVKYRDLEPDESEAPSDPIVDKDFERIVAEGDFDQLEAAFRFLVQLEELDKTLSSVSLKKGLRAVESDLMSMQNMEAASGCLPEVRVQQGFGISIRGAKGLRIMFANQKYAFLSAEDAPEPRKLILGPSAPTPISNTIPMQFNFSNPHTVTVPAEYVINLEKPIVVTLKMALELEKIASKSANQNQGTGEPPRKRVKEEDPFVGPFPSFPGPVGASDQLQSKAPPGHVDSFPSIQVLLAPSVFAPDTEDDEGLTSKQEETQKFQAKDGTNSTSEALDSEKTVGRNGKRARTPLKPQSEYVHGVPLPNGQYISLTHNASSLVPGVTVTKVPISELKDVYRVFSILRQQIAFNELFLSCYRSEGSDLATDSTPLIRELVEVGLADAPEYMHFGVYDARLDDFVGVGISIGADGSLTAKLSGTKRTSHPCTDEKATEILRKVRSVPRAIQAINQISMPAP